MVPRVYPMPNVGEKAMEILVGILAGINLVITFAPLEHSNVKIRMADVVPMVRHVYRTLNAVFPIALLGEIVDQAILEPVITPVPLECSIVRIAKADVVRMAQLVYRTLSAVRPIVLEAFLEAITLQEPLLLIILVLEVEKGMTPVPLECLIVRIAKADVV